MTLCDLCQTISQRELPPYPEKYVPIYSRGDHFYPTRRRGRHEPEPLGFPHHPTLEGQRHASATGCGMCRLIETQADGLLDYIETNKLPNPGISEARSCFDLWLTKGPYGADGFWVLTNSTWRSDLVLLILAAITFSSDDDDPLVTAPRERLVMDTLNETACNRIAQWVAECNAHELCSMTPTPLPTRFIDLGSQSSGNSVRLVEPDRNTRGHYISFSCCWGGRTHATTTRSDIVAKKKVIEPESLPRAFQCAIISSRGIGIRYLWVDSLCIFQDDHQDWGRGSANMATIYTNANLTFSGTGAENSSMGLFFPRKTRSYVRFPYTTNGSISGHVLVCTLPLRQEAFREFNLEMWYEPLSHRAGGF